MTVAHVPLLSALVGSTGWLHSPTPRPAPGECVTAAATHVLKRWHAKPKLSPLDKRFWVSARRFWSAGRQSLLIVTPETVVDLQGEKPSGKAKALEGCPRSDLPDGGGEPNLGRSPDSWRTSPAGLRCFGENHLPLDVRRAPREPRLAQRWRAFLANHWERIAAMDLFRVPHDPLRRPGRVENWRRAP